MQHRARVRVPATTANLGSGFDVVGLALDVHNEVELRRADATAVTAEGDDLAAIPLDATNLVFEGAHAVFRLAGVDPGPLHAHLVQRVPVASGLGSSAAALVGGAAAAAALLDEPVDDDAVVAALAEHEGHGEQVAAGWFGGAVAVVRDGAAFVRIPLPVHADFSFALVTPDTRLSTKAARAALPDSVSFADAVEQIGFAFALAPGLATGDAALLRAGTRDHLHQDPRAALLPAAPTALAAARDSGALASCWSGAGPTLLAIAFGDAAADEAARAMCSAFSDAGVTCSIRIAHVDRAGATLLDRN